MTNEEVFLAQAEWMRDNFNQHPTQAKQVLDELIENIESVIGGGGILNQPPS